MPMARTEARIKCDIWDDEDFRSLTLEAQWLYHAILEQKDLTLCGVLTWTPKRFAKLANNASATSTKKALDLLCAKRYVVIDDDTDELLVRTFITGDRVLDNPNSILGMSNAFGAIHSPILRSAVIDRLGQGFLDGLPDLFPKGLPKGFHDRLGKPFMKALALAGARTPPRAPVPPASSLLPPVSPSVVDKSSSSDSSVAPTAAEEEELPKTAKAAGIVAQRKLEVRDGPPITDVPKWLRSVRAQVLRDFGNELETMAAEGRTAEHMADRIMPPPAKRYPDAGEALRPAFDETTDERGHLVAVPRRTG